MSDFEVVHLKGFACSGRAVRFVPLDPTEHESVQLLATKEIDEKTGTMIDLKRIEWRMGVHQMIKQVSAGPVADPNAADIKWIKVNPAMLDAQYKDFFKTKDHQLLIALYRQYHDVSDDEIKAISGKVLTVSED